MLKQKAIVICSHCQAFSESCKTPLSKAPELEIIWPSGNLQGDFKVCVLKGAVSSREIVKESQ